MPKQIDTIYVELGLENLMSFIFGSHGHQCHAGHTPLHRWKRQLLQLFRTLKTAISKNVNGDEPHKEHLIKRCDVAILAIRSAKLKDEIVCCTLQFAFEIIFLLLGRFPQNWQKSRVHHSFVTNLAFYRTFNYVRTAKQKAQQITDAAYLDLLESGDPPFKTLIEELNGECACDPQKFLSWLRTEHRTLYDRFI